MPRLRLRITHFRPHLLSKPGFFVRTSVDASVNASVDGGHGPSARAVGVEVEVQVVEPLQLHAVRDAERGDAQRARA